MSPDLSLLLRPRSFASGACLVALSGVVLALHAQTPQPAQGGPPPFRLAVEYVEVDARVVDARGTPIRGLSREDFRVFEDGVEHEVVAFSAADIPVPPVASPAAPLPGYFESDVATNHRATQGRVFLFVLDDRHVDAHRTNRVRALVKTFITDNLGPDDLAAVIATSGRTDLSQDFTTSQALLVQAVDGFMGRKLPSAAVESLQASGIGGQARGNAFGSARRRSGTQSDAAVFDPYAPERRYDARSTLDAVRTASVWLAGIRGRSKALVLVSEGIDYNTEDLTDDASAVDLLEYTNDTVAAATRANVTIYPIDPRGLDSMFDEIMQVGSVTGDTSAISRALTAEKQRAHIGLRSLADETGGFAALDTNDFAAAFGRVVEQSSSYYVLGYYPTNARRDGKFREIDVRVDRPGARVTARRGYIESRELGAPDPEPPGPAGTSLPLREVLNSPLPASDLRISTTAAAFRGSGESAMIVVATETSGSDMFPADAPAGGLEVVVAAVDGKGSVVASQGSQADFTGRAALLEGVKAHGFRTVSRLDVNPGQYQLRIAAMETGASRKGAVWHDVDVPDFNKNELAMSGLLLARAASLAVVGDPSELLASGAVPIAPTTERLFSTADELVAFVEVYDNRLGPPHDIAIDVSVEAENGHRVIAERTVRTREDLAARDGTLGFTARFPLMDLAPGRYVLTLEAHRRGDRPQSTSRRLSFTVTR